MSKAGMTEAEFQAIQRRQKGLPPVDKSAQTKERMQDKEIAALWEKWSKHKIEIHKLRDEIKALKEALTAK
jgi:chemotaxis regulatin CheY-phosphate phosphatase CheZ